MGQLPVAPHTTRTGHSDERRASPSFPSETPANFNANLILTWSRNRLYLEKTARTAFCSSLVFRFVESSAWPVLCMSSGMEGLGDREPCAIRQRGIRITQARGASQGNLSSFGRDVGQEKRHRRSVLGRLRIYLARGFGMGDACVVVRGGFCAWRCCRALAATPHYQLATVR